MVVRFSETNREKMIRLRQQVEKARDELIEAEANLAQQKSDLAFFDSIFDRRVGNLSKKLSRLEEEIKDYREKLQLRQNLETFGSPHVPVEEQFKRRWQGSRNDNGNHLISSIEPADETELKRMFRKLARRFHPDLAKDAVDRKYRTEKMAALNDAYAARSLAEMAALAAEPPTVYEPRVQLGQTEDQMILVLQLELERIKFRLREIQYEIQNLHNQDSVEMSLKIKLAERSGRDLLGEMVEDLEEKIYRATLERDKLRAKYHRS